MEVLEVGCLGGATTTLPRGSSDSDRNLEGLSVKSLDEVNEPELDPRFTERDSESTLPSGRDNEKIYVRSLLCLPC